MSIEVNDLMNCSHENFHSDVKITRLTDEEHGAIIDYMVDVKVWCTNCKTNLNFKGMPIGLDFGKPTTDIERKEIRIPAEIVNDKFINNLS